MYYALSRPKKCSKRVRTGLSVVAQSQSRRRGGGRCIPVKKGKITNEYCARVSHALHEKLHPSEMAHCQDRSDQRSSSSSSSIPGLHRVTQRRASRLDCRTDVHMYCGEKVGEI